MFSSTSISRSLLQLTVSLLQLIVTVNVKPVILASQTSQSCCHPKHVDKSHQARLWWHSTSLLPFNNDQFGFPIRLSSQLSHTPSANLQAVSSYTGNVIGLSPGSKKAGCPKTVMELIFLQKTVYKNKSKRFFILVKNYNFTISLQQWHNKILSSHPSDHQSITRAYFTFQKKLSFHFTHFHV